MIFWFCLFFVSYILLAIISKSGSIKIKNSFLFLLLVLLIGFSSFRDGLGKDYSNYKELCELGSWSSVESVWILNEPISTFLQQLCVHTEISAVFFFFISAAVTIILSFIVYSKYDDISILLFIFITYTGLYLSSFNLVQQFFAASLFLLSSKYIVNKEYKYYYFLIFLAFLIHKSAIILLFIPLISVNKINHRFWILLLVISWIIPIRFILQTDSFQSILNILNYQNYLDYESVRISKFSITNIYLHILLLIILFNNGKLIMGKHYNEYVFSIKMFALALVCNNLSANDLPIAYRISVYFLMFMPISLSCLCKIFPKRFAYLMIVIPILFLMSMTIIGSSNNKLYCPQRILPLHSILDKYYNPYEGDFTR